MKDILNPLVSVITVCYNSGESLLHTAQSIKSQSYRPLEYIIIDGASTDGTLSVIEQIQKDCSCLGIDLQWVSEKDGGIYDAMNKGVKIARGKWLNFMNAGDTFASAHTVSQVMEIATQDEIDIIYGSTNVMMDFGTVTLRPEHHMLLNRKMALCHQSTLIKASLLHEHPYDLNFHIAADYEFFHWCYVIGKHFRQTEHAIANFESENGKSSQNRLKMLREIAHISGQNKSLKWKVKYALQAIEVGFNKCLRTIMPDRLTNHIRERNYQRIKRRRENNSHTDKLMKQ